MAGLPEAIVIHPTLLTACQAQPGEAVTLIVAIPPVEANTMLVGEIE
jgi:hypothetical protein